jgi:hypothetical protein
MYSHRYYKIGKTLLSSLFLQYISLPANLFIGHFTGNAYPHPDYKNNDKKKYFYHIHSLAANILANISFVYFRPSWVTVSRLMK